MVMVCALVAAALGCTKSPENAQPVVENKAAWQFATQLRDKVTVEAMTAHLEKLQDIANVHGGTRATGTPGYDASVDYVVEVLRDRGFDVETPEFEVRVFQHGDPDLSVGGAAVKAGVLKYSAGTPEYGVSGPLVAAPAEETPGCAPADYEGLSVQGAVVLVDRGGCPFSEKQAIAAKLGAVAMVVANNSDDENLAATLGENTNVGIPVVSVSKTDGARLRAKPGTAKVTLEAATVAITTRNVIAQTKTGSQRNVVMVGGHLDSVEEGAGMNDNGSGVSAVLETAVQLGSEPAVTNAVRFAFWGAEEVGIVGSRKYVSELDAEQLKDIALYLNFDMIGSPNPGYFAHDGDQSTPPGRDEAPPLIPEGTAGIERTLVEYLASSGRLPRTHPSTTDRTTPGSPWPGYPPADCSPVPTRTRVRSRHNCGAVRPTPRSTRITTRTPTPSTRSVVRRSTSTEAGWPTRSVSTPPTSTGATGFRPERTAPATRFPTSESRLPPSRDRVDHRPGRHDGGTDNHRPRRKAHREQQTARQSDRRGQA
jgi:Zn-dependent M28 family amino/carboxypeptidase